MLFSILINCIEIRRRNNSHCDPQTSAHSTKWYIDQHMFLGQIEKNYRIRENEDRPYSFDITLWNDIKMKIEET